MSSSSNTRSAGFTLIEMLVVLPLMILVVGGFIVLLVNLIGDVIMTRERNALSYEAQDGLNTMERDIQLTSGFESATTTLPSGQGSNSSATGTSAFDITNGGTHTLLILRSFLTSENPLSPTRQLVVAPNTPYACSNPLAHLNSPAIYRIVYYYDPTGKEVRRRVIVSDTQCSTPWQVNTCKNKTVNPSLCADEDSLVASSVGSYTIEYFNNGAQVADLSPAGIQGADSAKVTLIMEKQVAGNSVTTSMVLFARKFGN